MKNARSKGWARVSSWIDLMSISVYDGLKRGEFGIRGFWPSSISSSFPQWVLQPKPFCDARLSPERGLRQGWAPNFDVLSIDAFSSDSIPSALLTGEAVDLNLNISESRTDRISICSRVS
jgi:hypothetical protein